MQYQEAKSVMAVPEGFEPSTLQRAFADILVLSRAWSIAGPRASVFSQLAAHLGGLKLPALLSK